MTQRTDIRLYYTEKGFGPPLILLHGNGEDGSYFKFQTEYFSENYRVIAVDTRGHGKSPRGEKPFTIRQFAEDLYDFMEEKKIERADILGFSDGGNTALIFALRYPHKVNRLILNGANLYGKGILASVQIPDVIRFHLRKTALKLMYRLSADDSRMRKFCRKTEHSTELLKLMVHDPDISPEDLSGNRNPDFVNMKKLVIAGDRDMIKAEHTRMIYACLPNARLIILKGDHFIAAKCPLQFNKAVEEFLNE